MARPKIQRYTDSASMKLQRSLLAVLTFLLLFAQQAAYAHAVSHLGKESPPKEQLGHAQLCGKCISFEKLSAAAPAPFIALFSPTLVFAQPGAVEWSYRPVGVAAFHSRAPPALL